MHRAFLASLATVASAIAAPAAASASPALNFVSSHPFNSAVATNGVTANNVAYAECPLNLFPGEPCGLQYNQRWGTSAVTFYTSAGSITKNHTFRGPASATTLKWVGIPALNSFSTSFLISGPSISAAEAYAA
jgi:hypothetical protein